MRDSNSRMISVVSGVNDDDCFKGVCGIGEDNDESTRAFRDESSALAISASRSSFSIESFTLRVAISSSSILHLSE